MSAPRKAPDGLTRVLFVRCDQALLDALDEIARAQQRTMPGHGVSRSDVARELLYGALGIEAPRATVTR